MLLWILRLIIATVGLVLGFVVMVYVSTTEYPELSVIAYVVVMTIFAGFIRLTFRDI